METAPFRSHGLEQAVDYARSQMTLLYKVHRNACQGVRYPQSTPFKSHGLEQAVDYAHSQTGLLQKVLTQGIERKKVQK